MPEKAKLRGSIELEDETYRGKKTTRAAVFGEQSAWRRLGNPAVLACGSPPPPPPHSPPPHFPFLPNTFNGKDRRCRGSPAGQPPWVSLGGQAAAQEERIC